MCCGLHSYPEYILSKVCILSRFWFAALSSRAEAVVTLMWYYLFQGVYRHQLHQNWCAAIYLLDHAPQARRLELGAAKAHFLSKAILLHILEL